MDVHDGLNIRVGDVALNRFRTRVRARVSPEFLFDHHVVKGANSRLIGRTSFLRSNDVHVKFRFRFRVVVCERDRVLKFAAKQREMERAFV